MKKTQKERLDELFKLINENPELPILPMVDSEIVADDGYARWTGSWGSSEIDEYYITNEKVHFKDADDWEEIADVLSSEFGYDVYDGMSDTTAKEVYNNLPWIRAIVVNIDLPEV